MYYWIMLALAVIAEVASTIGMKYAATHSPVLGYLFMAVMISLSMYAFSRAVMHIPLAVSYAVWEGAGLPWPVCCCLANISASDSYVPLA